MKNSTPIRQTLTRTFFIAFACLLAPMGGATSDGTATAEDASEKRWLVVDCGIIGTASADILASALKEVKEKSFDGLLIRLDTPGGALESTRTMVKDIMASPVPVVVWVGPSGSRAGSAGAFITMAGHVAAMAPGTNIGAAHPIQAGGQDLEEGKAAEKVMNDTVAFIESIAERKGRNVEMARSFVTHSTSITDQEALDNKIIDLIATDEKELFAKINGMEVTLGDGSKHTIQGVEPTQVVYEKSLREKLLEILSNPNLFYLLFLAGMIGLGYELTHPGVLFPGIAGGICMILALIATSVLPISFGAAALMLVGVGLLVAEVFVPSFGILGIGGFTAFVLGSIFLVDPANEQGLRISFWAIAPGAITIALMSLGIGYLVLRSERSKVSSGIEAMPGQTGEALADFVEGRGQVRVAGEIWAAKTAADICRGDSVKVDRVEQMTLFVQKV